MDVWKINECNLNCIANSSTAAVANFFAAPGGNAKTVVKMRRVKDFAREGNNIKSLNLNALKYSRVEFNCKNKVSLPWKSLSIQSHIIDIFSNYNSHVSLAHRSAVHLCKLWIEGLLKKFNFCELRWREKCSRIAVKTLSKNCALAVRETSSFKLCCCWHFLQCRPPAMVLREWRRWLFMKHSLIIFGIFWARERWILLLCRHAEIGSENLNELRSITCKRISLKLTDLTSWHHLFFNF